MECSRRPGCRAVRSCNGRLAVAGVPPLRVLALSTGGKSCSSLGPRKPLCLGSDQPSHQEQDGKKSDYEPRTLAGSIVCGIEVCAVSNGPSLRNPSQHRWVHSCAAIWVHLTLDSGLYLSFSPCFILLGTLDICLLYPILLEGKGHIAFIVECCTVPGTWLVPSECVE